jgi:hypothetical protein
MPEAAEKFLFGPNFLFRSEKGSLRAIWKRKDAKNAKTAPRFFFSSSWRIDLYGLRVFAVTT